jgi:phosphatidate cytidylyltransferase
MTAGSHALWLGSAIAAVLLLASAIGSILKMRIARGLPHADIDNLRARIRSWWVMTAIVGAALWLGTLPTAALFAMISALALREFLAIPGAAGARTWITGMLICVVCITFMPALLTLDIPGYEGRNALLLAYLVLITQSSDVLQYIWGKLFGKRQIAPGISPSKTVAGFAGGVASATLLGASLWWITPFTAAQAAMVSLLIALLGFAGGLYMSAQKRVRGIKDWGNLIPGHGGVLDRIDSLWLPAPLFYMYVSYAA